MKPCFTWTTVLANLLVPALMLCIGPAAALPGQQDAKGDPPGQKRKPRFTVGKDTTLVTEPVRKDGRIDYVAAVNERLRQGVTPETNSNVLLWKAFGPRPEGSLMPPEFFQWLGVPSPPEKGEYFVRLYRYVTGNVRLFPQQQVNAAIEQESRAGQRPW